MVDQLEKPSRLYCGRDFVDDLFSSDLIFSDASEIYDRDPKLVFGIRRILVHFVRRRAEWIGFWPLATGATWRMDEDPRDGGDASVNEAFDIDFGVVEGF
ncbi:hypothetical protein U1Q18_033054 [Sarracenia purpurea var. burkii]